MKKIPKIIYLQIGEDCPDDISFEDLSEVSWCADKINENDIEYYLNTEEDKLKIKLADLVMDRFVCKTYYEHETNNVRYGSFPMSNAIDDVINKIKELK